MSSDSFFTAEGSSASASATISRTLAAISGSGNALCSAIGVVSSGAAPDATRGAADPQASCSRKNRRTGAGHTLDLNLGIVRRRLAVLGLRRARGAAAAGILGFTRRLGRVERRRRRRAHPEGLPRAAAIDHV